MRLIDGSALLKELRKVQKECEKDGQEMGGESVLIAVGLDDACDIVKSVPTVDAKPVLHGRWVKKEYKSVDSVLWLCSECNRRAADKFEIRSWKYCPSCGAKMDLHEES